MEGEHKYSDEMYIVCVLTLQKELLVYNLIWSNVEQNSVGVDSWVNITTPSKIIFYEHHILEGKGRHDCNLNYSKQIGWYALGPISWVHTAAGPRVYQIIIVQLLKWDFCMNSDFLICDDISCNKHPH